MTKLLTGLAALVAVEEGTVELTVDGEPVPVPAGAWLWIRPEQVYRFDQSLGHAQGTLILFQPGLLDPATVAAADVDPPYARGALRPTAQEAVPIGRLVRPER